MREEIFLLGRLLLVVVFIGSGINHLRTPDDLTGYAEHKQVPQPRLAVLGSGALMLVGAAAIALGIWMDLAALGLAVFVVVAALFFHRFWEESDPQAQATETAQFFKNISIAGACLLLVAYGTGPYTMTDGLF